MADALTLTVFFGDTIIVAISGWLVARALPGRAAGVIETGVSWLLASLLVVAASAAILGETGGFGFSGFFGMHLGILVVAALIRRRELRADGRAGRDFLGAIVQELVGAKWRSGSPNSAGISAGRRGQATPPSIGATPALAILLVGIVVALAVLAAIGEPLVYDALTYRLPRIAQWLQDGRIAPVTFDDQRLNYISSAQDLVVAWLVGAFPTGFRFTALAQTAGGVLLVGATVGLARRSGLSKSAALLSGLFTFGFANLAPQWTSAHNDLFAAGIFASSFYLLFVAVARGEGSALAGMGLAFAVAAKGTIFYALPSLAIWVAWLAWHQRRPWKIWLAPFVAGAIGLIVFVGPVSLRNHRLFGQWTAPPEALREHYGAPLSPGEHGRKLALNLRTAAAQLLDPHSQPWGVRELAPPLARRIAESLPESDPYSFENLDRRENLLFFLGNAAPNADFASFGVIPAVLLLTSLVLGIVTIRRSGGLELAWAVGAVVFFLVQNYLLQWHPWEFRYTIIVAPWLAIAGALVVERLPGIGRTIAWTLLIASGLGLLVETTLLGDQVGWQAWEQPRHETALGQRWRGWARGLAADTPHLSVALGGDKPIAWLTRIDPRATVRLASLTALPGKTAEDAVGAASGWLIVPGMRFAGTEGRVMARTYLDRGDTAKELGLAAYRALRTGETPVPVVYRNVIRRTEAGFRCELRFRSWEPTVRLRWSVPPAVSWRFAVNGATGELAAGEGSVTEIAARGDGLTEVTIDLTPQGAENNSRPPVVMAVEAREQ